MFLFLIYEERIIYLPKRVKVKIGKIMYKIPQIKPGTSLSLTNKIT